MSKPTLTIGIPTRNRNDLITDLLDDVFSQLTDKTRARVRILITDNASDVPYDAVIERYSKSHPESISYIRNKVNIGFSANVNKAVQSAESDFVLIMSDDDGLMPGTIDAVLSMIDTHPDVGIGMLGHATYDKMMTKETVAHNVAEVKRLAERFIKTDGDNPRVYWSTNGRTTITSRHDFST